VFTNDCITITLNNIILLTGNRYTSTGGLWTLDPIKPTTTLDVQTSIPITVSVNAMFNTTLAHDTIANHIVFYHVSLFSPSLSTWCHPIDAGHFTSWPGLTSSAVRKYLEDFENNFTMVTDHYPDSVTKAYNLVDNYKQQQRHVGRLFNDSEGVSFTNVENGKGDMDTCHVSCYSCNKMGYYVNDCPTLTLRPPAKTGASMLVMADEGENDSGSDGYASIGELSFHQGDMMELMVWMSPLYGGGVEVGLFWAEETGAPGAAPGFGVLINMRRRCGCGGTCCWQCIWQWRRGGRLHS
jgi:hypothetical protein